MGSNHTMKVKRSDGAIWRVIDGEVVVLMPEGAMLHALTGCGSRVWGLIEKETPISEIVQRICAEYEVDPQTAKKEIAEFVHRLKDMKLVEITQSAREEG